MLGGQHPPAQFFGIARFPRPVTLIPSGPFETPAMSMWVAEVDGETCAALRRLAGGDNELYVKARRLFNESWFRSLALIKDAYEKRVCAGGYRPPRRERSVNAGGSRPPRTELRCSRAGPPP